MDKCTRNRWGRKEQFGSGSAPADLLGPDPLTEALRGKIREALETLFEEELTQVLIAAKRERAANRQ